MSVAKGEEKMATLPQYDVMRRRLQSQQSQQRSEADDALKRRFASQGMVNSGAYAKAAEQQDEQFRRQAAEGEEAVSAEEARELQRQKEIQEQRAFQTSERVGGQDFAAQQAELQRKYGTGEREASQLFARGEREAGQAFSKDLFQREMDFKKMVFDNENYWRGLDTFVPGTGNSKTYKQAEHEENLKTNAINAIFGAEDAGLIDSEVAKKRFYEYLGLPYAAPYNPYNDPFSPQFRGRR